MAAEVAISGRATSTISMTRPGQRQDLGEADHVDWWATTLRRRVGDRRGAELQVRDLDGVAALLVVADRGAHQGGDLLDLLGRAAL